jgi:uncharacterized membrane protein YdjX (TVP38/TMEM64 family)
MIGATFGAWKYGYFNLDRARDAARLVEQMRAVPAAEGIYLAAYALAAALCLPVVVMTIIGGAFFGPVFGALFAWIGALGGTVVTHQLAARIAKAPLRRMFGEHRLLRQLRNDADVLALFRMRIVPLAPFGVFAYVAGLAGVSLLRLVLASALALIPSVVAYAYVGSELIRGITSDPQAAGRALRVAGYVTIAMFGIAIVPWLINRMRR